MSDPRAAAPERAFPLEVAVGPAPLADFVSMAEAAARLGISKRTLQRAIQRGELIAVKQGRAVLVATTAIDDFQARRQGDADPRPPLARPLLHLVDLSLDDLSDLADGAAAPELDQPPEVPPASLIHLPAPLTAFIGRSDEIGAVSALVARPDVRLVTLTGVGGVGKTRLALRVAEAVRDRFPDGAVFVPLASVRDPELVLPAIAQALGLRDGSPLPPFERLRSFILRQRILLVLDNFEQVTDAGPVLTELLAICPALTLLVTSRAPLRLSGERAFAVQPMRTAAAPNGSTEVATELGRIDAIALFVDRAQAVRPSFTLTAELAPVVAAICERLEGLPLAIELAAARCGVLTPVAMLSRLDQRLPLLTGGPRDQPDRLRTMRNAIAWSHDLLNPAEQAFFRRLSVFSGGISLDAAEAIAALPGPPPAKVGGNPILPFPSLQPAPAIFDLLSSLVDGTLLQPVELVSGDQRYVMLETVREFAAEQLDRAGEAELARGAHAAYFTEMAEQSRKEMVLAASEALVSRFDVEHDNFRAAMTWSLAADPHLGLRLTSSLAPYWDKRGFWAEGRAWLDRALAASAQLPPSRARALTLTSAGMFATLHGEFAPAKQLWAEGEAMAAALGEDDVAAPALRGLGIIASNEGDLERARTLFEQALAKFRAAGNRDILGLCLSDLGQVAARQGDLAEAIRQNENALIAARAVGNQWHVCLILGNLSEVYVDSGDMARGEVLATEALELSRQLGDTYGVAIGLYTLGNILNERQDAAGAIAKYLEMFPVAQELGEQQLLTRALDRLGIALHRLGADRPAARLFGAAAAAREAIGDTLFVRELEHFTTHWQAVQAALGETMYEAVWHVGRSVPLNQAVVEAAAFAQSATAAAAAADAGPAPTDGGLTKREQEVLRLVAAGRSDREIAETLFVARTTASKHVSAILDKLQAGSRTEAVAIALRDRML